MILDINPDYTGQIGIKPRTVKILCDDSYATVTTANYLSSVQNQGIQFFPTDIFWISYLNNAFGIFLPIFNGNSITLTPSVEQGDVELPVVNNNLAKFTGTEGTITDSGIATTTVNTFSGSLVNGNLPKFSGTAGILVDSGIAASAIQLSTNIYARQYTWAGGSASNNFVLTGLTSSSLAFPIQVSAANSVNIIGNSVSTNTVTVTWSGNPGATVVNILFFLAPQ